MKTAFLEKNYLCFNVKLTFLPVYSVQHNFNRSVVSIKFVKIIVDQEKGAKKKKEGRNG